MLDITQAKTLIVMVGLPGSGKSTMRKKIEQKLYDDHRAYTVLSKDDILEALARKYGRKYEDVYGDPELGEQVAAYYNVAVMMAQQPQAASVVIHDRMNLTAETRLEIIRQFPYHDKIAVYMEPNLSWMSKARIVGSHFRTTVHDFPMEVIAGQYDRIERPRHDEGFRQIVSFESWSTYLAREVSR